MGIYIEYVFYGHYEPNTNGNGGNVWVYGSPNSAGGVSVKFDIYNTDATKVLKYAYVYVKAYNAVGDDVPCTATGKTMANLEVVGPLNPYISKECLFENVWYNNSIKRADIDHVDIVYMDGSTETMSRDAVKKATPKFVEMEKKANRDWYIMCAVLLLIPIILIIIGFSLDS